MSDDVLRHYWHPVAASGKLGAEPFGTRLLNEELGRRVVASAVASPLSNAEVCIYIFRSRNFDQYVPDEKFWIGDTILEQDRVIVASQRGE